MTTTRFAFAEKTRSNDHARPAASKLHASGLEEQLHIARTTADPRDTSTARPAVTSEAASGHDLSAPVPENILGTLPPMWSEQLKSMQRAALPWYYEAAWAPVFDQTKTIQHVR